jgi:hypothetical protein
MGPNVGLSLGENLWVLSCFGFYLKWVWILWVLKLDLVHLFLCLPIEGMYDF